MSSRNTPPLKIGGVSVVDLLARAGQTPFYAYDRAHIAARITALRARLPESVRVHYAIKANPMPALVGHLARLVDGLDVASAGELRTALDTGMPSENISFAGPGKTHGELTAAIASGILLNVESIGEIERCATISQKLGKPARIAIRINPDFELKSSGMRMGGGPKPFGIDAETVPAALALISKLDLAFEGFHLFAGSQNLRAEAIIDAQRKSWELILRLTADAPSVPRSINLGGGFGIPYFSGEKPLDLEPISDNLASLAAACAERLPGAHLKLELGRYLVGEAGYYVFKILERKESRGLVYLVTDGGMHHHLAASGNFGQVLRKNYPMVAAARQDATEEVETVSVVGPLCTPLDLLGDKVSLPHLQPGDLLAIPQSGAYGPSASPSAFLGHPAAIELLV